MTPSLSAQIGALQIIVDRATPQALMKVCMARHGEAGLLIERLTAALRTLQAVSQHEDKVRQVLKEGKTNGG